MSIITLGTCDMCVGVIAKTNKKDLWLRDLILPVFGLPTVLSPFIPTVIRIVTFVSSKNQVWNLHHTRLSGLNNRYYKYQQ